MITLFKFWKLMTTNATYHEYLIAEEFLIMNRKKGCVQTMWPYEFSNNLYNFGHQKNCTEINDKKIIKTEVQRCTGPLTKLTLSSDMLSVKATLTPMACSTAHRSVIHGFQSFPLEEGATTPKYSYENVHIDQKFKKKGWRESSSEDLIKRMKRM